MPANSRWDLIRGLRVKQRAHFCVLCGSHRLFLNKNLTLCPVQRARCFHFHIRQSNNTLTLDPPEPDGKTTVRIAGNYSGVCYNKQFL